MVRFEWSGLSGLVWESLLKVLNKENEVFGDLLYQDGMGYGEAISSFLDLKNGTQTCDGWMLTDKHHLLDITKADDLAESIKHNTVICPKLQFCGDSGTFIRKELFNSLNFSQNPTKQIFNKW